MDIPTAYMTFVWYPVVLYPIFNNYFLTLIQNNSLPILYFMYTCRLLYKINIVCKCNAMDTAILNVLHSSANCICLTLYYLGMHICHVSSFSEKAHIIFNEP